MKSLNVELPTWQADVRFRRCSRLIACAVLETGSGLTLVDPGPTSTLKTLERALIPLGGLQAVNDVVLTHIHLDHAGCVGQLAAILPEVTIHVHPIGAQHLINPERLIRSATRIYKERMGRLWGAILPVPANQVHAIADGTSLQTGGRTLRACYTPGHASHHIAWFDNAAGVGFAGDAAGMRIEGADYIIPVAPPPDIDLVAWEETLSKLEAENPKWLFLTHFGLIQDVKEHLHRMRERLRAWSDAVRCSLNDDYESDAARAAAFHKSEMTRMRASVDLAAQEPYDYMGQPRESWYGLARYWRKKLI